MNLLGRRLQAANAVISAQKEGFGNELAWRKEQDRLCRWGRRFQRGGVVTFRGFGFVLALKRIQDEQFF